MREHIIAALQLPGQPAQPIHGQQFTHHTLAAGQQG
jgi:hypothetical protein